MAIVKKRTARARAIHRRTKTNERKLGQESSLARNHDPRATITTHQKKSSQETMRSSAGVSPLPLATLPVDSRAAPFEQISTPGIKPTHTRVSVRTSIPRGTMSTPKTDAAVRDGDKCKPVPDAVDEKEKVSTYSVKDFPFLRSKVSLEMRKWNVPGARFYSDNLRKYVVHTSSGN